MQNLLSSARKAFPDHSGSLAFGSEGTEECVEALGTGPFESSRASAGKTWKCDGQEVVERVEDGI